MIAAHDVNRIRNAVDAMENPSPQVVGSRINATRENAGIPVTDLAGKTGIATVTLYRRLNGDENCTLGELLKLSTALDTPLSKWVAA